MNANGQPDAVLHWPSRVVVADELRRRLNGHRELLLLPQTVVTPLAREELRTQGILVRQEEEKSATLRRAVWGFCQERHYSMVACAAQAMQREKLPFPELPRWEGNPTAWASAVVRGDFQGVVLFCNNPALACCMANKVAGLRAAAVTTLAQAALAQATFAPNLVAVEMPGRTFFEIRQILRMFCQAGLPRCPDGTADIFQELDGHAHR